MDTFSNLEEINNKQSNNKTKSDLDKVELLIKNAETFGCSNEHIMKSLYNLGYKSRRISCTAHSINYLMSKSDDEYILYLPKETIHTTDTFNNINLAGKTLRVLGGKGIKHAKDMFIGSKFKLLDLSRIDAPELKSTESMCYGVEADEIILNGLNTSGVFIMISMFSNCKVGTIDLTNLDVSHVRDMCDMFSDSKIKHIKFNTANPKWLTDISFMFKDSYIDLIDLGEFKTIELDKDNCCGAFENSFVKELRTSNKMLMGLYKDRLKYMSMLDKVKFKLNIKPNET